MAVFKSLTFDGINSLDYGIYITGEAVYNAPERVVEMVEIPGRNGSLAIDQGRFTNIEVSYPCGCFADTQADFAEKVSTFRNAIASRYSYKRLTDEYNTDEYRLGLYKSGLEVSAVRYGTAGEFTITFDCKPQRFLLDGDAELSPTDYSDVQTVSGDIVQIENDGSLGVKSLTASLEPIQDLHGYDKPWVGGTGKNKLPYPYYDNSQTKSGITYTVNSDGTIKANGTATAESTFYLLNNQSLASIGLTSGTYALNGCPSDGSSSTYRIQIRQNGAWREETGSGLTFTYDASSPVNDLIRIDILSGATVNDIVFKPMIRLSSVSDATYEPYENICPISGYDSVVTSVSPTTSASDATTYTTNLSSTRYGGTLDVVSGVLTVTHKRVVITDTDQLGTGHASTYGYYVGIKNSNDAKYINEEATAISSMLKSVSDSDRDDTTNRSLFRVYVASNNYVVIKAPSTSTISTNAELLSAINNVEIVYELATPQTVQLTPQQIDLLLGTNHLWSDGEITVEYGSLPYYNPTEFESKPLIKVTGTGVLGINNYSLTILGTSGQTIYIDCDTQEAWEIVAGGKVSRNDYIQNAGEEFPVLDSGNNNVTLGSGLSDLKITPRWWRV